MKYLVKH